MFTLTGGHEFMQRSLHKETFHADTHRWTGIHAKVSSHTGTHAEISSKTGIQAEDAPGPAPGHGPWSIHPAGQPAACHEDPRGLLPYHHAPHAHLAQDLQGHTAAPPCGTLLLHPYQHRLHQTRM